MANRLRATAFYAGLAPLLGWTRRVRQDAFLRHHRDQALAVWLVLFLILAVSGVAAAVWSWLIVHQRAVVEAVPYRVQQWAPLVLPGLWLLLVLAGVGLALAGSARPLWGAQRLAAGQGWRAISTGIHICLYVVCLGVTGLALHASALCREEGTAPVHVLYDDMDAVPAWVFKLGAYRIALAAESRWGPGSVVVAPLTPENLAMALQNAEVMVLLCHGTEGHVITPHWDVFPANSMWIASPGGGRGLFVASTEDEVRESRFLPAGGQLRFVYNTACDGGTLGRDWEKSLAPAQVVTFRRLSAVAEHTWWLWFEAPDVIE